jgi:hypothetical protein
MRQRYDVLGFGLIVLGGAIFAALGTNDVSFTEWLNKWQGFIGAVVGAAAAIFAGVLAWRAVQHQISADRADMEASIVVAQDAANAAKESAQHLRNAERPFITPFDPTLRNFTNAILGSMDVVHVHFGLQNIAKGTGFVLSYGIAHEICADGQQGMKDLTVRSQFGRLPLGPGSRWQAEAGFDVFQLSDEDRAALVEYSRTFYVYGYIRYLDLFGVVRRTGFAYELMFNPDDDNAISNEELAISVSNSALWYDQEE